jgi:hypothetical protein
MAHTKTVPKAQKSAEPTRKRQLTKGVPYNTFLDEELSNKAMKYCRDKKIDSVQQVIRIVLNDFLIKNGY